MPFSNILTTARQAVWTAINNWSALDDVFATTSKLNLEDNAAQQVDIVAGASDLPVILVQPISLLPEWWTNRMQQWPYTLQILIFTTADVREAEQYAVDVLDAIYQYTAEGQTVPHVKLATGFHPKRVTLQSEMKNIGPEGAVLARQTTITLALRLTKDPFGD